MGIGAFQDTFSKQLSLVAETQNRQTSYYLVIIFSPGRYIKLMSYLYDMRCMARKMNAICMPKIVVLILLRLPISSTVVYYTAKNILNLSFAFFVEKCTDPNCIRCSDKDTCTKCADKYHLINNACGKSHIIFQPLMVIQVPILNTLYETILFTKCSCCFRTVRSCQLSVVSYCRYCMHCV